MSTLHLAEALLASKGYADAIPYFEASLRKSKRTDDATSSAATAHILINLGFCCSRLGNYVTAIAHLRGALAIEKIDPMDRIAASDNLTESYGRTSQFSLALTQGQATTRFVEAAFTAGSMSTDWHKRFKAISFATLSGVYEDMGRPSDALLYLEPALELYESWTLWLG